MKRRTDDQTEGRARIMTLPELGIVEAWHKALNSGDVDSLVELSHPDVEVGGPRGTGQGVQLLRDWVVRANIHITPRRVFHRAGTVVVEQWAQWRSAETGQLSGSQTLGSVFVVRDYRIARVMRYPSLTDAMSAANVDESHEIRSN